MKIDTNLYKNFFSCFDESRGVALHKKKILKNKKSKCLSYIESKLIMFIILLIISLLFSLLCFFGWYFDILSYITYFIATLYLVYAVINVICIYNYRKKNQFSNSILINEEGITDESFYGIRMLFNWNKITGIVIGKYSVTILTDTPVYFYFDISKKDDIVKLVEKYSNKDKIIY